MLRCVIASLGFHENRRVKNAATRPKKYCPPDRRNRCNRYV
jgi:hypothetical protein